MLLEFRCENYKSIKNEIALSMLATKDKEKQEILFHNTSKKDVLPAIAIYGANGAGKTNIINALRYMRFLVIGSKEFTDDMEIPNFKHKLNNTENTSFMIQFIQNDIRFAYGFTVNKYTVVEEYLYHFKKNRQAIIFEREEEKFKFGKNYSKGLTEIKNKFSKGNKLFLPIASIWSKIEEINLAFKFFESHIVIKSANLEYDKNNWLDYTINMINLNDDNKKRFITFLNILGISIKDIDINIEEVNLRYEELPYDFPEEAKMLILNSKKIKREIKLKYNNIEIDLAEESMGIKKLFELGGPILDIISKGGVLVYDEIEKSLHPFIAEKLVTLFNDKKFNKNNAQLIFSAYDTNLLDLSLFRRDQIWFVEKDEENYETVLYSLSDLKNIRQNEDIEKGYIRGKYGAIPFINNNCLVNEVK